MGALVGLAPGQGLGVEAGAGGFLGFSPRLFGRAFGRGELAAQPFDLSRQVRVCVFRRLRRAEGAGGEVSVGSIGTEEPHAEFAGELQAGQGLLRRAEVFVDGRVAVTAQEMEDVGRLPRQFRILLQAAKNLVEIGARIEVEAVPRGDRFRHMLGKLAQLAQRRRRVLMEGPFGKGAQTG